MEKKATSFKLLRLIVRVQARESAHTIIPFLALRVCVCLHSQGKDGRLIECAALTPLQRTVKKARLTRVEVVVLVLYTGPMFLLYNGILRGFGHCGEVKEGIEFGSDAFRTDFESVTVATRVKDSKNKFASTIHVLASAIKKLQRISDDKQGTTLYRGLGGLDVCDFVKSQGFTEKAFMSTTKSLKVAMEYSGVKQGPLPPFVAACVQDACAKRVRLRRHTHTHSGTQPNRLRAS